MKTPEAAEGFPTAPLDVSLRSGEAMWSDGPDPARAVRRSFGPALRREREKRGMGLRRLATLSGLSASYLSLIEHGHVPPPSRRMMNRLAKALGMNVDDLLASAGVIPDYVLEILRERPVAIGRLMTLIAPFSDEEVTELCEELRRRLTIAMAAGRRPKRGSE